MIGIAIAAMDGLTKAVWDISDFAMSGDDSKGPCCFDGYPAHMRPRALESVWHHCSHEIASLVAKVALAPLAMTCWQAQIVSIAHLASTVTSSRDE